MGTWGPGIFSDDTAADVRDDFKELIADGVDGGEATTRIVDSYASIVDDPDEGPVFWLALAAVQHAMGRLQDDVRDRALQVIDSSADLLRWEAEASAADAAKRRVNLDKLRVQLAGPQKKPSKVRAAYREVTDWEVGQHWAYRLASDRWIVLRVVGIRSEALSPSPTAPLEETWPGTLPVVEVLHQGWDTPPPLETAARAQPRTGIRHIDVETTTTLDRLIVARATKRDFPAERLQLLGVRDLRQPRRPTLRRRREPTAALVLWKWLDRTLGEEWRIG